jgi:tetratricopeptide (TPR) repeat protein
MEEDTRQTKPRRTLRGLRPLLWWFLFVLVLYGIRKHQEWIERTRLSFSVTLEGKPLAFEVSSTLDSRPVMNRQRVSLGFHTFTVTHPKAEPYSTNLFVWYGENNLGEITLKRLKGTLDIQSHPAAKVLRIHGPEFSVALTNRFGFTSTVPADRYYVEAKYSYGTENTMVTVPWHGVGSWRFAPALGAVELSCNQPDATFHILRADEQSMAFGKTPLSVSDLPEGSYRLLAWHHGNRREENFSIKAGETNRIEVKFLYGAAVLDTDPPGASVSGGDGRFLGTTPLQIVELPPGEHDYILRLDGYEPAPVLLTVAADQTNTFRTNLLNSAYVNAMSAARQYLAASAYVRSLELATAALEAKPNDPDAVFLQKQARIGANLQQAERFGKQGDFAAAIMELKSILKAAPEKAEAKQMLADFERQKESLEKQQAKRQQELAEQQRLERLARPKKVYDSCAANLTDVDLFDTHVLTTTKALNDLQAGIIHELRDVQPSFKVFPYDPPAPETFKIIAEQELPGGFRSCLIVGGQAADNEVQIFFKVREFVVQRRISSEERIPIHPSRINPMTDKLQTQLKEGSQLVTERIQQAIGPQK